MNNIECAFTGRVGTEPELKTSQVVTHRIIIEPTAIRGERGRRYSVHFAGSVLIEDTWNPEYDACRALIARGVIGRFETWRMGATFPCMRGDIETAARFTIEENAAVGPKLRKWRDWDEADDHAGDAVSCGERLSQTAENGFQVCQPGSEQTAACAKFRKPMQLAGAAS